MLSVTPSHQKNREVHIFAKYDLYLYGGWIVLGYIHDFEKD